MFRRAIPAIALLLALVASAPAALPIRSGVRTWDDNLPLDTGERPSQLLLDLSGVWSFRPDPKDEGLDARWQEPESWTGDHAGVPFRVPGVWNEGQEVGVQPNYNGAGWFRRTFDLPDAWYDNTLELRFMAVYLVATVWLNGVELGSHRGGYTAFSFDVSAAVAHGTNTIIVRVDNTPKPSQAPHHSIDWWNTGGITREVYLVKRELPTVERLSIRASLNPTTATMTIGFGRGVPRAVRIAVADASLEHSYTFELDDSILSLRRSASLEVELELPIPDALPWSPESPNLYIAKVSWQGEDDDWNVAWERFGFREVRAVGSEVHLNGSPVWLQGMAFHQDYPGMGSAGTREAQRADLLMCKQLGCNFVRLGHYPFHPDSLDLCDEMGLLVWSEIPVWQNPASDLGDPGFNDHWVYPQLREMLNQLGNHPSIIVWSVGNEFSQAWLSRGQREDDRIIDYVRRTTAWVRERDSSRLVSYASAASTGVGTWEFLDVIGKPLHYGWFHSADVYDLRREVDMVREAIPDKPILCVELAGMSYTDRFAPYGADERHSLEYHDKLLRVDLQSLMSRRSFVVGTTVWTLRDLKGGREIGTYGLFTRDWKPKYLYDTVKRLYAPGPRVLIHEPATRVRAGQTFDVSLELFGAEPDGARLGGLDWFILSEQGVVERGELPVPTPTGSVTAIGSVRWEPPKNARGFHLLVVNLRSADGSLVMMNDLPFDVVRSDDDKGETPAHLWVDADAEGVRVTVAGIVKTTDALGKVPFVLPGGTYDVRWETPDGSSGTMRSKVRKGSETTATVGPAAGRN